MGLEKDHRAVVAFLGEEWGHDLEEEHIGQAQAGLEVRPSYRVAGVQVEQLVARKNLQLVAAEEIGSGSEGEVVVGSSRFLGEVVVGEVDPGLDSYAVTCPVFLE